ncbi:MAG: AAA family ATPase [Rubrivivax sp.]|nr:AAA family ATPase [Rubrivivax sp.]
MEPFELKVLEPGLNIFTGPNEAGKSTLVRAIRAAFFERHRSTSVDDLRPYGDSAATPSVELDFEIQGTPYRLTKSFLQKKRCELMVGTRRLEGVEAEDFMAERLGFQFALKGASREAHWGIPGLLWIEQGPPMPYAIRCSTRRITFAARWTNPWAKSLPAAATRLSPGSQAARRVVDRHRQTQAEYQKAIDDAKVLEDQVVELERSLASYRDQVDQLRQLRDAHVADTGQQPWARLRQEQGHAQQALQAVDALANEREAEREKLRQVAGLRELLLQRLDAAEQQQRGLASREIRPGDRCCQARAGRRTRAGKRPRRRRRAASARCARIAHAGAAGGQPPRTQPAAWRRQDAHSGAGRPVGTRECRSTNVPPRCTRGHAAAHRTRRREDAASTATAPDRARDQAGRGGDPVAT